MAKMSGGMGMAGMFGPPGVTPPMASKKQKSSSGGTKEKAVHQSMDSTSSGPPRNAPGMALPGRQRVRSPDQEPNPIEVSEEKEPFQNSITQGRQPEEMPEAEVMEEEPTVVPSNPEEKNMRTVSILQSW